MGYLPSGLAVTQTAATRESLDHITGRQVGRQVPLGTL